MEPFNAQHDEVYTPTSCFIDFLKDNGFKKDIFAISSDGAIEVMRNAGLNVIDYEVNIFLCLQGVRLKISISSIDSNSILLI